MKRLAILGGAGALSVAALLQGTWVDAADHLDGPNISMAANKMADINDVYAWMTTDTAQVNLAMTVSPADDGTPTFGPSVQYVFHVDSVTAFGDTGKESKIICTFESDTNGQCWVVDPDGQVVDHVSGDFSALAGGVSASGKFRVFAGRRSDPFFFNLSGFLTAVNSVKTTGGITKDAAGCPLVTSTFAANRRAELKATPTGSTQNGPCAQGVKDCFASFNVMAIVVQVDKNELLVGEDKLLSVWASTHAAP